MQIVSDRDPYVFVDNILPDASRSRYDLEHRAGIHLLSEGMTYAGYDPNRYILCEDERGKPYFQGMDNTGVPSFSISHSKGIVACAVSKRNIGCDIEKAGKVPANLYKELGKVRTIRTNRIIRDLESIQFWTVYEAVGKYLGTGIPLDDTDVGALGLIANSWLIEESFVLSIVRKRPEQDA